MKVFICCAFLLSTFVAAAQTFVNKKNAVADIDFMNKTIEEVHYNPYLFITKEQYQKKTDSIKKTIGDSIELKTFIRKLYSLTASIKDGHTSPSFVQNILRPEFGKKLFAPFSFITDENDYVFFRDNKLGGIEPTDRILSINNKELTPFAKEIHQYYGGREAYATEIANKLFSYLLYLTDVRPPFSIKYQHGKEI